MTGGASTKDAGGAPLAIDARALVKRYLDGTRRRTVVDEASLAVTRGEWIAITGPSGAGKSTLLGLLGGMIAPTAGELRLLGEDVVHLRDHHRAEVRRRLVGFVFQDLGLVPAMTLDENVLLPLVPTGGPTATERARIDALCERFGLGARRRARAAWLSGGERQRGAIVRALVRDPAILLLDEPTAHVDATGAAAVLDHLATLAAEGRTIVVTTHDPRLTAHAGVTRTLAMRDGRLEAVEPPAASV